MSFSLFGFCLVNLQLSENGKKNTGATILTILALQHRLVLKPF